MKINQQSSAQGFTFLELVIVLVILGTLTVLAVPTFNAVMVAARRGEAKTNLGHIESLQATFKVASSSFTYGTIPLSNPVGYGGECGGSGLGWKNEIGFRPQKCGELRYRYWSTASGSSFTAAAYGVSDQNGKWIYNGCEGGGTVKTCGSKPLNRGDALEMNSSTDKVHLCRDINEFCPAP